MIKCENGHSSLVFFFEKNVHRYLIHFMLIYQNVMCFSQQLGQRNVDYLSLSSITTETKNVDNFIHLHAPYENKFNDNFIIDKNISNNYVKII